MLGKMTLALALIILASVSSAYAQESVLKDHTLGLPAEPPAEPVDGLLDCFLDPDPSWSAAMGVVVTGNGEQLGNLTVFFGIMGLAGDGDPHELEWLVAVYADTASFSMDALRNSPAIVFDAPSNPDWEMVVGSVWGFIELRRATFDLRPLNHLLASGQTYLIAIAPRSRLPMPATIASLAVNVDGTGMIGPELDWYHRGDGLGQYGPGPMGESYEGFPWVAAKVTTFPPPSTGACCNPTTGACSVVTQADCSGTWTPGGNCTPDPCPQPTGACCNPATGGCQETTQADCTANWQGVGTTCTPNTCPLAKGDMNCDHAVSTTDIPLFVEALLDPAAFDIAHPTCLSTQADMGGDGLLNGLDIQAFVNLLIGG